MKIRRAIRGFGLVVGLGAVAQMGIYFFQLVFLGYSGVLVYEPDPIMRTGEFFMALIGFVALFYHTWRVIPSPRRPRKLSPQELLALGFNLKYGRA